MIAPLRRRHRFMIATLALTLPTLVFLALDARPSWPDNPWPTDRAKAEGPVGAMVMGAGSLAPSEGGDITVQRHPRHLTVQVNAPLRAPDVLAYWIPADAGPAGSVPGGLDVESVPDGAFLLGSATTLHDNVYRLPQGTEASPGTFMLYSLGHQRRLTALEVPLGNLPRIMGSQDPQEESP